jgi:hypothetical protein
LLAAAPKWLAAEQRQAINIVGGLPSARVRAVFETKLISCKSKDTIFSTKVCHQSRQETSNQILVTQISNTNIHERVQDGQSQILGNRKQGGKQWLKPTAKQVTQRAPEIRK